MIEPTAAAQSDIDELRKKHGSWRSIAEHVKALPPRDGALARVLSRPATAETIESYVDASRAAEYAQKQQRGVGWYSALFGFAAAAASGLLLFMKLPPDTWGATSLNSVHAALVAVALVTATFLKLLKPGDEWGKARTRSESARLAHFDAILEADEPSQVASGELPYKALALEYVRAYLL